MFKLTKGNVDLLCLPGEHLLDKFNKYGKFTSNTCKIGLENQITFLILLKTVVLKIRFTTLVVKIYIVYDRFVLVIISNTFILFFLQIFIILFCYFIHAIDLLLRIQHSN